MISVAIIPCYKSKEKAAEVAENTLKYVDKVICVDDKCPYSTGDLIKKKINNENLLILKNKINLGVGGAFKRGLAAAIDMGADYIIKVDSDGQMNPELIPLFLEPLKKDQVNFVKGNFESIAAKVVGKYALNIFFPNISCDFAIKN